MRDFLATTIKETALSGRLREAVEGNDRAAAVEAIADLAASAGYEVGPADVEAFRRQALAEIEGDLSETSLGSVTAGAGGEMILGVAALGAIAGAAGLVATGPQAREFFDRW